MTGVESLNPIDVTTSIKAKIAEASLLEEQARPLREFTPREIDLIKELFIERGLKIEGLTEAAKKSLLKEQFRGKPGSYSFLEKGRGPGMIAVMGRRNVETLIVRFYEMAVHVWGWEGHRIGGYDGTQGRGPQQMAADLISIAVFGPEKQRYFLPGVNQRILKGLRDVYSNQPLILGSINRNFSGVPEPQIPAMLASVPPGSLRDIWSYLMPINKV